MLVVPKFRVTGSRIQGPILAYFGLIRANLSNLGPIGACFGTIWAYFEANWANILDYLSKAGKILVVTGSCTQGPIWAYFGLIWADFRVNVGILVCPSDF